MTTYYVDPDATGADNGTTKTDAWTSLQRAIDGTNGTQPGAGDIVECKSAGIGDDEVLSTSIIMDGTNGNQTNGRVKFIGVNSSWVNDGTRYVINANSQTNGFLGSGNYKHLENFEIYNASGSGVDWTNANWYGWFMRNLISHDNSGSGFDTYYSSLPSNIFLECQAYNNTLSGYSKSYSGIICIFCSSHDNGGVGFDQSGGRSELGLWFGCLSYDNNDDGFCTTTATIGINLVSHGNTGVGYNQSNNIDLLIGSRLTSNSNYGVARNSGILELYHCYIGGNTTGDITGIVNKLLMQGSSTITESGTDTNQGYTSITDGSEDFNLRSDATQRNIEIGLET